MAISGFGRGRPGDGNSNSGVASSAPAPAPSSGGLTAFIDQGSQFEGKLSFKDTVRIDGEFTGEISSENTLIVGETGEIEATIRSTMVVVSGSVMGNIYATKQVVLHKNARVEGDLECPSIVIEEGALFNGSLKMRDPSSSAPSVNKVQPIKNGENGSGAKASGNGNGNGNGQK